MNTPSPDKIGTTDQSADQLHQGMFGTYLITDADRREVTAYRVSVLTLAVAQLGFLVQWAWAGSTWIGPWLVLMAVALGLALHWIHIYLRPLHQALRLLWLLGVGGGIALVYQAGPTQMGNALLAQPLWIIAIGPYFAALTGLGFKEFFCFRRLEAVGVTALVPLLLMLALLGVVPLEKQGPLWFLEAVLLLVMAVGKFRLDPAADIGDKSVFQELEQRRRTMR
ncbi:MAG: membrane protein [Candidatus Synechococcus spongiarum 15L]|uniref:Membrane protein n=1 Tax=Candidatus Synechococcus spongiarum 15L TaxID=1608419 RepID=A0A0G8AYK0_9SYNE|nr:MAG: membrane protein [Candidatus Synechococcus spongiarum 15L]